VNRLERIDAAIERTTDKKLLGLLNLAWWKEFFRLAERERKAA
jgi:hypothetical protein